MRRPRHLIVLLALSLPALAICQADEPKPAVLTPEEQKLAAEAAKLDEEGIEHYQRGRPAEAVVKLTQALEIHQRLFPASKYPDGHPDFARCLNNLGTMLQAMGRAEKAFPYLQQSLDMKRRLFPISRYPDGHPDIANGLNNLAYLLQGMGQAEKALPLYDDGLAMRRRLFPPSKFPDGHPDVAQSLNNLGLGLNAAGQSEKAVPVLEQGLDMLRKVIPEAQYPDGHPNIASSLNNLGFVLDRMGQSEKALPYFQQSLDMRRKLFPVSTYPDGHPHLATSLTNHGVVLNGMGQAEKALPFYEQGLDMMRKLFPTSKYPDGHPDLATSLDLLGTALDSMGQSEKALPHLQQSLDMTRKLFPTSKYPNGHPALSSNLNGLAGVLTALGQAEQAIPLFQESLDMSRTLYPVSRYADGHPDLARSINSLGWSLESLGKVEQALPLFQECLDMNRMLYPRSRYPDGHLHLAHSLQNLGHGLQAVGQLDKALSCFRQSLEIQQRLMKVELQTASERAALERLAAEPPLRDRFLSVTRSLNHAAVDCYTTIAPSRTMVTRLLERRHANARAAGTVAAPKLDQLRSNRRRTEQLLQDSRMNVNERDKLLVQLADERDTLERELLDAMPTFNRWQDLDQLGPLDLMKALPPGAVFVDLIVYRRLEFIGGKLRGFPSYVAFVLAQDKPIQRVELEEARPINEAIASWRTAIEVRRESAAAALLKERIWDKLAPHLPPGTKTLYLAADGDLARLPWGALPTTRDRVLLEDYAVALVPHGAFLLDHLKFPRTSTSPESLLTLGGIEYGPTKWPTLPGTSVEVNAVAALAPGKLEALTKTDATPDRVIERLPKARFAHLATHGEFQAEALTAEKKRAAAALAERHIGDDSRKVAANNPLGYVGLVLSNGEVLSGLSILDLPLENLKLVTLSACETGLGEYTGGEGVQGLQRAFHLAGCPNVVASLWKVNDAATAALMVKFYHELWVNKKPPIEALREAQLTIYRRPDLIPILAAERGLKLDEAVNAKSTPPASALRSTAPTKLWAAFVLSGAGR